MNLLEVEAGGNYPLSALEVNDQINGIDFSNFNPSVLSGESPNNVDIYLASSEYIGFTFYDVAKQVALFPANNPPSLIVVNGAFNTSDFDVTTVSGIVCH
jgi:hypothetical protein